MEKSHLNKLLEEKDYEAVMAELKDTAKYFYKFINAGGRGKFISDFYFYRSQYPTVVYYDMMYQLMEGSFEIAVWETMEKWDGRGTAFGYFWSELPKKLGHMYRAFYNQEIKQNELYDFVEETEDGIE